MTRHVQRVYPYCDLAAQVIGFVGKDNQGIVEAKYDDILKGEQGKILTVRSLWVKFLHNSKEYRQ